MNKLKKILFHHFEKIVLALIIIGALYVSFSSLINIVGKKASPRRYEILESDVQEIIQSAKPPADLFGAPLPEIPEPSAKKTSAEMISRWSFYNRPERKDDNTPFKNHRHENWFVLVNGEYRCLICGESGGYRWIFEPPVFLAKEVQRSKIVLKWKNNSMNSVADEKVSSNLYRVRTEKKNRLLNQEVRQLLETSFSGIKLPEKLAVEKTPADQKEENDEKKTGKTKKPLTAETLFERSLRAVLSELNRKMETEKRANGDTAVLFFAQTGYSGDQFVAAALDVFRKQGVEKRYGLSRIKKASLSEMVTQVLSALEGNMPQLIRKLIDGKDPLNKAPIEPGKSIPDREDETVAEKDVQEAETDGLSILEKRLKEVEDGEKDKDEGGNDKEKPSAVSETTVSRQPMVYEYVDRNTEPLQHYTYIIEQFADKPLKVDTDKSEKQSEKKFKTKYVFCPRLVDVTTPSTLRFWLRGSINMGEKKMATIEIAKFFKPQQKWYFKTFTGIKPDEKIGKIKKIYLKDENGKILKKDKISSTLWNKIKDRLGGPVTSLIRMPLNFYTGFTLLELKEGKKSITETRSVTRLDENGQPTFETVKVEVEREGLYMIIRNDLTGEKSIRWQTKSKDLNLEEE